MTAHDEYYLGLAMQVASRATCIRRQVGCVLVNSRGHILSTGFNGPPSGIPHCIDKPCAGAGCPSGEGLEECMAVHAEANALLQCKDVYEIQSCYVTVSPCIHCIKLLMNTSCENIIFREEYANVLKTKDLWVTERASYHMRNWTFLPPAKGIHGGQNDG